MDRTKPQPAFPSQEGKSNTGPFTLELELRAGRWLNWVSVSCAQQFPGYQIT